MEKFGIEDLLKFKAPENVQYNPSGTVLAYQCAYIDQDKYKRDVHVIEKGIDHQLTSTINASIVLWLDDETILLRRSTEDTKPGTTDLYTISIRGGEAIKCCSLPVGMTGMKMVKENHFIVSATIDANDCDAYKDDEKTKAQKLEEKKKNQDYQIIDEVPYWSNGAGFTNKNRSALFEMTMNPFTIKRITTATFDTVDYIVDGEKVYFIGNTWTRRQPLYYKIYSYDVKTKTKKTIYNALDYAFYGLFVLDHQLYVRASAMKEYGCNERAKICKVHQDTIEEILNPGCTLYSSSVGDTLLGGGKGSKVHNNKYLTLSTIEDHNEILSFDGKFKSTSLYSVKGIISCFDVTGTKLAFIKEDWNHIGEVYEYDCKTKVETKCTSLNDVVFKGKYIAKPKRINYESQDYKLHGWVLLPEGFNPKKKYPAVLDIHGGPQCVYTEAFFHEMQVWVAKGYVVMFTNIKGSDGRDDAFVDLRDDYGYTDFENLMDFVDAVLAKYPNIDPKKLCETGGSYGGFMSNWIITHTNRFCAVASQRSISNWISMSFISDIGLVFGPDQCGAKGLFGIENTMKLWEHSPLAYADKVKTPTLFIHSDEDYRCPLPEGMQMMQALAARNVETRMVIFHGENHELSRSGKPSHRIKRLEEITNWFDHYTKRGK